jgi:hypothetical protein
MDRQVTQETVATRLNKILNDIAAGAKARDLQGLVFVGSADKRTLGKITREHYSNNSTLAKKRAEFVQKAMAAQLEARVKAPQPHWMLVLNPELPRIRLSIDEAKRFDALRAVQICVAWTRKNEQEASR